MASAFAPFLTMDLLMTGKIEDSRAENMAQSSPSRYPLSTPAMSMMLGMMSRPIQISCLWGRRFSWSASVAAVNRDVVAMPVRQMETFARFTAAKKVIQCAPRMRPVMRARRLNWNEIIFPLSQIPRTMAAIPVRQMTRDWGGKLMSSPSIAVEAMMRTKRCSLR